MSRSFDPSSTHSARRRAFMAAGVGLLAIPAVYGSDALAEEKPALKIVCGFPPGGTGDLLARIIADSIRDSFSSIIVENRAGAAGRIALGYVKRQPADGSTLIIAPDPGFTLFPHLYKKLDYDPVKDFTPIAQLVTAPYAVTAGLDTGVTSMQEMARKVKAAPSSATIGTSGLGAGGHVIGVWLSQLLGTELLFVPFQGGAPANVALLGGQVSYRIDVLSDTLELHRNGKARIIGVTGPTRTPLAPDIPTIKEQGIDLAISSWMGLFAPANMPTQMVANLNRIVVAGVASKATADKLIQNGFEPATSTPAELAARQRADFAAWEKPAKATGLKFD